LSDIYRAEKVRDTYPWANPTYKDPGQLLLVCDPVVKASSKGKDKKLTSWCLASPKPLGVFIRSKIIRCEWNFLHLKNTKKIFCCSGQSALHTGALVSENTP